MGRPHHSTKHHHDKEKDQQINLHLGEINRLRKELSESQKEVKYLREVIIAAHHYCSNHLEELPSEHPVHQILHCMDDPTTEGKKLKEVYCPKGGAESFVFTRELNVLMDKHKKVGVLIFNITKSDGSPALGFGGIQRLCDVVIDAVSTLNYSHPAIPGATRLGDVLALLLGIVARHKFPHGEG
ncbi:MAG: hypothetical protein WC045_01200 [Patescibacteria group bacterium]